MDILLKLATPIEICGDNWEYVGVSANKSQGGTLYTSFHPANPTSFGISCMMLGNVHEQFYINLAPMPRKNQKKIDAVNQWLKDHAREIADAYLADYNNKDRAHTQTAKEMDAMKTFIGL